MKQMDASDRTRYIKTKTLWYNYVTTNLGTQAGCVYNNCDQSLNTTCKLNYTSYEQRENVSEGKQNVYGCSTLSVQ